MNGDMKKNKNKKAVANRNSFFILKTFELRTTCHTTLFHGAHCTFNYLHLI